MFDRIAGGSSFGRHLLLAGIAAGSTVLGVSAAFAGSCPSGQMRADARQPVAHAGKGVTDTVLAAIDLDKEPANIKDRALAQPRRPSRHHLHRRRRDRRIRQQLRGSDRAQGR
jgi:hypothetical protein